MQEFAENGASKSKLIYVALFVIVVVVLVAVGISKNMGGAKTGDVSSPAGVVTGSEDRLQELKTWADAGQLDNAKLAVVATAMTANVAAVDTFVTNGELSAEESIKTLSRMSAIMRAQKEVVRSLEKPLDASAQLEEARDALETLRGDRIDSYAAETDLDTVRSFISERISALSEQISAGSISVSRIEYTNTYILDTIMAIEAEDYAEAVHLVTRAEELIESDRYLLDFGPQG